MEVADALGMQVLVAGAPSVAAKDYEAWTAGRSNVQVFFGRTYDILKYADAAVINSGTASLEAAIIGTPQVVCWSTSAITWWYAKNVLKVGEHIPYISLGNLCLGREAFKELLQEGFNKASVLEEVQHLLNDNAYRSRMLEDYRQIRESLGGSGASQAVAKAMTDEIKSNIV